jgi:hypothetical protein
MEVAPEAQEVAPEAQEVAPEAQEVAPEAQEVVQRKQRKRFLKASEYDLMIRLKRNPQTISEIPSKEQRAWKRLAQNYVWRDEILYKRKDKKNPSILLEYVDPRKKKEVIEYIHNGLLKHGGWHRTYSAVSIQKLIDF